MMATEEYGSVTFSAFLSSKKSAVITCDEHAKKMLKFFYECWKKKHYCDITIKVDNETFETHKMVLAMVSEYFRVLFKFDEKEQEVLTLTSVTADIFRTILKYAYTGEFTTDFTDLEALVISADYLRVTPLKNQCENHLIKLVNFDNCFYYLSFSDMYSLLSLFEVCLEFFRRNFVAFAKQKEFYQLQPSYLQLLLNEKHLRIYKSPKDTRPMQQEEREKYLFKSVMKYIIGNMHKYVTDDILVKMLASVKLPYIDLVYRNKIRKKYSSLQKVDEIKNLFECAKMFDGSNKEFHSGIPRNWYTPRAPTCYKIYSSKSIGGNNVGRVNYISYPPELNDPFKKISSVEIFLRRWDGRLVLGGLKVTHDDGSIFSSTEYDDPNMVAKHSFLLAHDEVITQINRRSGWLIDSLEFISNKGNAFGPFGGDGGDAHVMVGDGYLHSVSFATIQTQGMVAVIEFRLHWVRFN